MGAVNRYPVARGQNRRGDAGRGELRGIGRVSQTAGQHCENRQSGAHHISHDGADTPLHINNDTAARNLSPTFEKKKSY